MSLIHGNEVDDLKIKMIKEILSSLEKNMKLEKLENRKWQLKFFDPKYSIFIEIFFLIDKDMVLNFELFLVGLGQAIGNGLCKVICTYMLRKLYNLSFDKWGKSEKNIMLGKVYVHSETPLIASKCYIDVFNNIGFTIEDVQIEKKKPGFTIFFSKNKPKDGWEKINEPYVYDYKRLNIKYFIGKDKIWVEKFKGYQNRYVTD